MQFRIVGMNHDLFRRRYVIKLITSFLMTSLTITSSLRNYVIILGIFSLNFL